MRGAPPTRLHAAQQQPFAQASACSMWRAGLGEHYLGCAPPKAPGQCAHWLAGLPGPELHRRSVPKAHKHNGPRGVAQRPPQPTAARARAQEERRRNAGAHELHAGPKPRAGRRSYPTMPPCWGAPRTPAGAPGAVPAPLLPPFRSEPNTPVGAPGHRCCAVGAPGLTRAPLPQGV